AAPERQRRPDPPRVGESRGGGQSVNRGGVRGGRRSNAPWILESAPPEAGPGRVAPSGRPAGWRLTARTPEALLAQAARLFEHLSAAPPVDPHAVGRALALGRSLFAERAVLVGEG
ncbi:hypothetical protein PUR56_06875, partial [Streptomyces sp. BE303]|nr:hypothetical protein [Streptomyces sp. BE303]